MSMREQLNRLLDKRHDYRAVFMSERKLTVSGERVLLDLARFCHSHKTTTQRSVSGQIDPIASAIAEGRRQVYLRIANFLQVSDSAIIQALEREND